MRRPNIAPSAPRGVSLIEVLVVIVLFSFGLLGLVNLQARALQVSVSAEDSNRAALLANELASTMWNNNTVNVNAAIVSAWQVRVAAGTTTGLPNGTGTVTVAGNLARITVSWTPPGQPSGAQASTYLTEVLIP
jgi:type IV pilus assembly protein PilV